MNYPTFISCMFALLCCINPLFSSEWKSPDGFLSVETPDSSKFANVHLETPVLVSWIGKDNTITMGVVRSTIPQHLRNMKINQKSAEAGFIKELNGTITESSQGNIRGYPLYKVTAQGNIQGNEIYTTQYIVGEAIEDQVYKIMVTANKKDDLKNPDVEKFLNSFKILQDHPAVDLAHKPAESKDANSPKSKESLVDLLSQKIGGPSLLLLIICLAVLWSNKRQKQRKSAQE